MSDEQKSIRELLLDYANVLDDLAATEAIRSKNNPVADYAEWLVAKTFGFDLAAKSSKGHDAIDASGTRYEVKARRLTAGNGSRQLSAIRGLGDKHFDTLVGVLFDHDFNVFRAAMIPWTVIDELASHRNHTNSAVLILRDSVWDIPTVVDVTEQLRSVNTAEIKNK